MARGSERERGTHTANGSRQRDQSLIVRVRPIRREIVVLEDRVAKGESESDTTRHGVSMV